MKNFWSKPNEKIFGLASLDRDTLIYRVLPRLLMEILRKYFRMKVVGVMHIPRRGPAIIAPNHSGYSGFDALVLSHVITQDAKRVPRILAHYFWFLSKTTAVPAHKMGFTEATFENGISALEKKNLIVLFPEGEHGNFKPSSQMYQLQEFKRGFVRMALKTQSPIIPTLIIGAEETHINLSQLKFTKFLRGLVIPLPLNVIPLPAKWKIRFLEPIELPYGPEAADDDDLVHEICGEIREKMQKELTQELRSRSSVYL
jgi:1-acyl-sn-glycerol-3-phosphate acyltransferase